MPRNASDSARPARALPPRPNLEHLKNEAKQRLKALRKRQPQAKLAVAQLAVARDYGFASWRQLKAQVEDIDPTERNTKQIFAAARAGDVETVRRAFEGGFDPGATDQDGRTIHQIAKAAGHTAIELLARQFQERDTRPPEERKAIDAILDAAENGRADELGRLLDVHPGLINARGGGFWGRTALHMAAWRNRHACVRLLLERSADVRIRDYGDNAYALHFAAEAADFEIVEMLAAGWLRRRRRGRRPPARRLGWATCFRRAREDVAEYLLRHGAKIDSGPRSRWIERMMCAA